MGGSEIRFSYLGEGRGFMRSESPGLGDGPSDEYEGLGESIFSGKRV